MAELAAIVNIHRRHQKADSRFAIPHLMSDARTRRPVTCRAQGMQILTQNGHPGSFKVIYFDVIEKLLSDVVDLSGWLHTTMVTMSYVPAGSHLSHSQY